MRHYLKFAQCNVLVLIFCLSLLQGGWWLWLPFLIAISSVVLGDALLPKDLSEPKFAHLGILNFFLFANLPLLLLSKFLLLWLAASGDPLQLGYWAQSTLGWDLLQIKQATTAWHLLGGFIGLGLMFGMAATNVAHELVHRTWSPVSMEVGRFLLAFTWDSEFAIEHVYGHHRRIATWDDPATARRGESFFRFFIRSTWGGNVGAWHIEKEFLRKRHKPLWSWQNRVLRGWLYSGLYACLSLAIFGPLGLLLHLCLAFYGKGYLELVNYIEHFGLVRVPGSPVRERHSWNSNHAVSGWYLFNLTRHSHHHETGHLPFWKLAPKSDAPMLPYGYMTMIFLALIPALYQKIMRPYLEHWDQSYASQDEQKLLAQFRTQTR